MKFFPILSAFFVTCSGYCDNCDLPSTDSDLVEVIDGYHIKLIKFEPETVRLKNLQMILQSPEKDYSKGIFKMQVDLGMAATPVLDQGAYGTCVTFAATAALDALLGNGDFVDQQCSLELDMALGQNWWNGAYYPSQIIDPLKKYGVVKKNECDNLYPRPNISIAISAYGKRVDKNASDKISKVNYKYSSQNSIVAVKAALDAGHRVLIGFLLNGNVSEAVRGFNVIRDGKVYQGGLWACQQGNSMNYCSQQNAGHEVLIVGYDDNQQLFKIRNSWNIAVGEQGDYYMTYKFFESMAIDNTEVW